MSDDSQREIVLSIDTAFIPRTKREGGRTFEAVVCQTSRGGRGKPAGPTFAFSGTNRWKFKAFAAKALSDQDTTDTAILLSFRTVKLALKISSPICQARRSTSSTGFT